MAIDNNQGKMEACQVNNEHLLSGLFTPGEKQISAPVEQLSHQELLLKNEQLIAEITAHADRIAAAAVMAVKTVPSEYHADFLNGISCFNSQHDVVYNAFRAQWNA